MQEVEEIVNSQECQDIIKKQEEHSQKGPDSDEFYAEKMQF